MFVRGEDNMKVKKPKYWGSWKGDVIKAISIDDAKTWGDLLIQTGLSDDDLKQTLSELFKTKEIKKKFVKGKTHYRVLRELYHEYREHFAQPGVKKPESVRLTKPPVKVTLLEYVDKWRKLNDIKIDLADMHFFLQGSQLDEFSRKMIHPQAKQQVIVVNPFVEKCSLSETLADSAKNSIDTILITRKPERKKPEVKAFHDYLKKSKVKIHYSRDVHAKIIVVDNILAIVSSMNFYPSSSAGKTWEAGLVTYKKTIVNTILDNIKQQTEKP